jgi:hypothetical protein
LSSYLLPVDIFVSLAVRQVGRPCHRRVVDSWLSSPKKVGLCAPSRTRLRRDWQSTVGPLA